VPCRERATNKRPRDEADSLIARSLSLIAVVCQVGCTVQLAALECSAHATARVRGLRGLHRAPPLLLPFPLLDLAPSPPCALRQLATRRSRATLAHSECRLGAA